MVTEGSKQEQQTQQSLEGNLLDRLIWPSDTLTLSNTRKHLSAPHREDTSFSLSSSWFKLSTHSFTVERNKKRRKRIKHQTSHWPLLFWGYADSSEYLLPLSTMWSSPPSSRSSSLNQSPARFEVRDSNVSMAKWPVYRERGGTKCCLNLNLNGLWALQQHHWLARFACTKPTLIYCRHFRKWVFVDSKASQNILPHVGGIDSSCLKSIEDSGKR